MRLSLAGAAALALLSFGAGAARLEAEVAPGVSVCQCGGSGLGLTGRGSVATDFVTTSLVGNIAPFDPGPSSHQNQGGGLQAWSVLGEVRLHNRGTNQVSLGLGVGWGQLTAAQDANGDLETYRGQAAPTVQLVAGYRHQFETVRVGVDLTMQFFNRINYLSDVGAHYEGQVTVFGLGVTIGL